LKNDYQTRTSTFWFNDRPEEVKMSFRNRTRDAFVQMSLHKTSIKAGIQTLSWGESDFAIVTDEMSPMDFQEPLNLNIDELKNGQLMLVLDQFSPLGDLSVFFIPYPKLNEYPKEGTKYYYDLFNGSIKYRKKKQGFLPEYGMKWKKTFGKSDVSILGASLINNEYALSMDTPGIINQSKYRFFLFGTTLNYVINKFLIKGEAAIKSSKTYNDAEFQIVNKDNLDASLGIDYSLNNTLSISMEAVNYHVLNWNDKIQGVTKNNYMLLLIFSKQFINNDLSVNWVTMYNGPYTNFFNLLTTYYNLNNHVTLYLDVLIPITENKNSGLYIYRDQKQVVFKIQYLF
jgi:hypothetical protein